jgi:hypothetical protein
MIQYALGADMVRKAAIICIASFLAAFLFSCASTPQPEDQIEVEQPVIDETEVPETSTVEEPLPNAAQSTAEDENTQDENGETGESAGQENGEEQGTEDGAEAALETGEEEQSQIDEQEPQEPVEPIPDPEPPRFVSAAFSPLSPVVGETVTVIIEGVNYDVVEYDFGFGFVYEARHIYDSFGIHPVSVRLTKDDMHVTETGDIPVAGLAVITLDGVEIEHNMSGKSVITATINGKGEYDEVRGYYEGNSIFSSGMRESYELPIDFVGARIFSAVLFGNGVKVADCNEVTITGLNSPPSKPEYEGGTFLKIKAGDEVAFSVSAADPNDDEILYELKPVPDGADFNVKTGEFSWTPEESQTGMVLLNFRAYDLPFMTKRSFAQRGLFVEK